jgi:Penicillin binding protein transpeptidase domain
MVPGGAARTAAARSAPAGGSPDQDARQVTARTASNPAAAHEALASYRRYLHLRRLTAAVLTATGQGAGGAAASGGTQEPVSYAVAATVALSDDPRSLSGIWRYTVPVVAFQLPDPRAWSIAWAPEMLAPGLQGAVYPVAVALPPKTTGAVGTSGTPLAAYSAAALTSIASELQVQAMTQAWPGLMTTIGGRAEAAARSAVSAYANSSMVAIQPSTGKILAVANAGDNDDALLARVAPGPTMKVITSAALLSAGVPTASSGVACPRSYTVQGVTYHNDNDEAPPAGTSFVTDFAQSRNNARSAPSGRTCPACRPAPPASRARSSRQLADRLRPRPGRRRGVPGHRGRLRRPVRRPRSQSFPRQILSEQQRIAPRHLHVECCRGT